MTLATGRPAVADRARRTAGRSDDAIHDAVERVLAERRPRPGAVLDVGCGTGGLAARLAARWPRYVGVDAVRHAGLDPACEFHAVDLDAEALPLPDDAVDLTVSVETIEHLENPRRFVRELARVTGPGGMVIVTTPNQLSALSLLCLLTRGRFVAFQDVDYPAHVTALLESDLRRIAGESGLTDVRVDYTRAGRMPLTRHRYPAALSAWFPRRCSDNVVLSALKPA
jgi:2-polyprenyl-3-methyl-5-hydroxy-6-metoxy-1,4-benzoquinol methylase